MKTTKQGIMGVLTLLLASAAPTLAIEGLKIKVVCPDVVLSWPSTNGETYIVQYRATLDTNDAWATLTNSLPALSGTNLSTFVHSNMVDCPPGQIFGMMSGGSGGSSSQDGASEQEDSKWTEPMIMLKDESSPPAPLAIFPPGLDLSGWIIIWPDGSTEEWTKEFAEKYAAAQAEGQGGPQLDSGGGSPSCGFYRVVRVGINLFGITNGTVLSGQVPLPLEFGNPDTNGTLSVVFLSDNDSDDSIPGSAFSTLPLEGTNHLEGIWDTTQVTNGVYVLQVGARLEDGTVYLDHPVTVTVSNTIWFPDPWNVGGLAVYVGAQTIYTNGTWHLDIYDDQNAYVGFLEGNIGADGYCNYPGIPGPGFSLDNTDGSGNQNPSAFYTLALAVQPAGGSTSSTTTKKVFIEPAWFGYTWAVTCYQQVFAPWQPGADEVIQLVNTIWNVEQAFHQNLLGTFTVPFEVQTAANWATVTNNLASFNCRDFIYFGHGSDSRLGSGTAVLKLSDVQSLLSNNFKNPLAATNMHPYRFVFLDGCNTADGDWPQAFGIPRKTGMVATDFTQKRGIRPRAFMGWNRKKVVGTHIIAGGQLYTPHEVYMGTFWNKWAERAPGGGPANDLTQAKAAADIAAPLAKHGMVVYGAKDLVIDF